MVVLRYGIQGLKIEIVPSTFAENLDKLAYRNPEYAVETSLCKAIDVTRNMLQVVSGKSPIFCFGAPQSSSNGDDNFVEKKALVEYSKLENDQEGIKPHSLALSEFHFLLLFENKVKVVNRVRKKVIEELQFD